jgi:hypothetical protein
MKTCGHPDCDRKVKSRGLCQKHYLKAYYVRTADDRRAARYGLSADEYRAMFEAQAGVCALCAAPPGAKALHVDHCHATGKVRGLLCHMCNLAVGLFKDDPAALRKAAAYLERSAHGH